MKLISSFVLACLLLLNGGPLGGAEFYVAPDGLARGNGSLARPWNLQTAFKQPAALKPGDTLYLRGGTYSTTNGVTERRSFDCHLVGTADEPILITQYPGETAVIDGCVQCRPGSAWYQFRGFRITCSDTNRVIRSASGHRPGGLFISGRGVKVINMIIDNSSTPIFWADSGSSTGDEGEIYGCIIWGGGEYDHVTPPGDPTNAWIRGSAIYAQNVNGKRYICDNICFRNFTSGPLINATAGSGNGFVLEGNISFDPGGDSALMATTVDHPITSITIVSNYIYSELSGPMLRLGYVAKSNQNAQIANNYVAGVGSGTSGLFYLQNWESGFIRSNFFFSSSSNKIIASLIRKEGFPSFPLDWNYNCYYTANPSPFITNSGVPHQSFGDWKDVTGYDRQSVVRPNNPRQLIAFTRRNKYDPARSHLVVYNWTNATHLSYNLAEAGLKPGDTFEVRDGQDYLGAPVRTGVYDGQPIRLPLNLTNVAPIYGTLTHFQNKHTSSRFNAFVIIGSSAPDHAAANGP